MKPLSLIVMSILFARAFEPPTSIEVSPPDQSRAVPGPIASREDTPAGGADKRRVNALLPVAPGFTGSAHDFFGPMASMETRCAPCHATSSAVPDQSRAVLGPIDRREDTPALTRARLVSAESRWQIAESTRLCLSCHDGVLASEIVGGGHDADLFAAGALVNLRRDHPVGVEYPRTGRSAGASRRDFEPIARLATEGAIKLPGGRVECISCHDPHAAFGHPDMLVKSNRRSALCLSCHRK